MAATGKTPILLYGSTTATNTPVAGNLTNSADGCEIAINVADKNLFFKDATNTVNTVPIRQSSTSSNGWLSSTDWNTFNGKVSSPWVVSGSNIYYNAGIVGVGSTLSAWNTNLNVLQVNGGSVANNGLTTIFASNLYYDSGYTPKYIATGHAGSILYNPGGNGGWAFYVTSSGSAGATATLTQATTMFASGGVSIGNTTDPGATNLSVSGKIYAGTTTSLGTGELNVRGGIIGDNSSGDGNFNIEARSGTIFSNSIYNSTTAVGASVCITNVAGFLQRSTSSIKYKTQVEDLNPELSQNIYKMRPVWYRSLCETDKKDWSWYGLIAEEMAEIEPRLVHWGAPNEDGVQEPEGVMYDRLTVFLLKEVQALKAKIESLEKQNGTN